jgi:hypothetical protein
MGPAKNLVHSEDIYETLVGNIKGKKILDRTVHGTTMDTKINRA